MVYKTFLIGLHQDSGSYFESASTYSVLVPKSMIEQQGASSSLQSENGNFSRYNLVIFCTCACLSSLAKM